MSEFGGGFVLGLIVAGGIALGIWETIYLARPWNVLGGLGLMCMTLATLGVIALAAGYNTGSKQDGNA